MILSRMRSQSVYTYTSHTNIYIQWPLQLLLRTNCELARGLVMLSHMGCLQVRLCMHTCQSCICTNIIRQNLFLFLSPLHLRFPSFPLLSSHLFTPFCSHCHSFLSVPKESSFTTTAGMTHWLSHSDIMELEVLGRLWCESHKSEQSVLHWWTWWCWNETRCVRCDGKVRNLPPEYRADKSAWTEQKRWTRCSGREFLHW